ncbi:MAG: hypothetical protein DCC71_07845 [Proteobacteria bacterium]|nr:MAG: hypothetical protein DCC71_07845 [Pseudomonadota bacterium]
MGIELDRRTFLAAAGVGAGWLVARGLGARGLPGVRPDADFESALRAFGASLTAYQREHLVFPADHPSRQINNTFAIVKGPHLGTLLSPAQRVLLGDLYESMLSARGREAFAGTVAVEGRLDGCVLAIYGEPTQPGAEVAISGGHLLLRGGAASRGAAFGGGVAYGHQIGDGKWRVPGNSFAYHGDAFNRFFATLTESQREAAILPAPPHELLLQVQAAGGSFPGVAIGSLSPASRGEALRLLEAVFSCYPEERQREAFACIEHNGGIGALHAATYASHGFYEDMQSWDALDADERARRGDPYWQVWRVEGPGSVIHFKGHPHVHAYIDVVRDPARANLGEPLAKIDAMVEGEAMRTLLEAALRRATGSELAFHGAEVPGRFCPGEVTTGLAWSLDPYANRVVVASIEGREMALPLRHRLGGQGVALEAGRHYRIATTDYFGRQEEFGRVESIEETPLLLRDALVEHLRAGALG